jgi:hypothetical protein
LSQETNAFRDHDTRPKCVIVLGDGFTQGFLSSQGLLEEVQSRVSGHFQNHPLLAYEPSPNEIREGLDQPFWSRAHWPKLHGMWSAGGFTSPAQFYEALALESINPSPRSEGFDTRTVAYELRCYLWHMMRAWQLVIRSKLQSAGVYEYWNWFSLIAILVRHFKLTAVNFNYDETLADALYGAQSLHPELAPLSFKRTISRPVQYMERKLKLGTVVSVHVHGSVVHWEDQTAFSPAAGEEPCPWIRSGLLVVGCQSFDSTQYCINQELVNAMPFLPSLVPPGHNGMQMANHMTSSHFAPVIAHHYIGEADVVIFCGLSGAAPDTFEVRYLAGAIRDSARVYQIGLDKYNDRDNKLGHMLRSHPHYAFVDASDLRRIPNDLGIKY